jgi:hypothetical protein
VDGNCEALASLAKSVMVSSRWEKTRAASDSRASARMPGLRTH